MTSCNDNKGLTNMEWQPIETAPRDMPVLIWDDQCVVAGCSKLTGAWFVADTYGFCEDGQIYNPTHWMPLPPPPITRA
jgi:hypothetical protein